MTYWMWVLSTEQCHGRREECWEHPASEWAAAPFSDKLEVVSCEVPALGRRFFSSK